MMNEYRIKVYAEQKKEKVELSRDGRLLVFVNAKREEGRANERAIELVSSYLRVPRENIAIMRGHNQSTKTIRVTE